MNETPFTWSLQLQNTFMRCQLAYFYQRIAAHNDMTTRQLSCILTLEQWSDAVIRQALAKSIGQYTTTAQPFSLENMKQNALSIMRETWMQYLNGTWKETPESSTNIFELYYGEDSSYGTLRKLPQEMTDAAKNRIMDAIETFFYSRFNKELLSVDKQGIFFPAKKDAFHLENILVQEIPDFIYQEKDGKYRSMTWTLGNEYRPALRLQQACHLLYTMEHYNTTAEKISVGTVFLNDGGRSRDYIVSENDLNYARSQILKNATALRSKETDSIQQQDYLPSPSENCAFCNFKRLCLNGN